MPNISLPEIMVVGVIALIVFGPQRLPEIARTVGRTLNELRKQASEVRAEFQAGLTTDEPDDEMPDPIAGEPPSERPAIEELATEEPVTDEIKPGPTGS